MKIVLAINTLTAVDNFVYSNHAQLYYRMGRHMKVEDDLLLFHPFRMSIDRMRNTAIKVAFQNDCKYVFFIDDDVQVPHDAFFRLASHDKDIVAGVTYIRGYPFHPMIFRVVPDGSKMVHLDNYVEHIGDNGLISCDAVGFSCVLIKTDLIRKMSSPYCITGTHNTEDIYFCVKAKDEVPDVGIYVDPTVQTAHKLSSEFIQSGNIDAMKKYMEAMGAKPEDEEDKSGDRADRTKKYLEENKIEASEIKDIESRMRVIQV